MKRIIILITLIVGMVGILISCAPSKGTSTGNPLVSLSMASSGNVATVAKSFFHKLYTVFVPQSEAKAPPAVMADANNNNLSVSNFWISLGKIEFKYSATVGVGEVDGTDVEFVGPFAVDMLAATPVMLASGPLVASSFRRIKYKLSRVGILPVGAPTGLSNNAIYISGTVNGNAFTFSTQSEIEMTMAGPNLVAAQNLDILLLQIKLANLIRKINFSAVTGTTAITESNRMSSGSALCPTIDASATDIYTCIMLGLANEGNLGRDLNGDGEFQATEPTVK